MKFTIYTLFAAALTFTACDQVQQAAEGAKEAGAEEVAKSVAGSPEEAAQQMAGLMDQMSGIFEGVTDKAGAEQALEKITPIVSKIGEMKKLVEGQGGAEISPELQNKIMESMKPSQERFQAAIQKLTPIIQQNPELAQKFTEVMQKMSGQ